MEILLAAAALFMIAAIALAAGRTTGRQELTIAPAELAAELPVELPAGSGGRRVFLSGLLVRLVGLVALLLSGAIEQGFSRDSLKYHDTGLRIAEQYAAGDFNWANWIDNGWYQFTGLVYHLIAPEMVLIQLLNVVIGALAGLFTYRIARQVFADERLARFAGYLVAFFPSFVYYSTLPLKDAASLCALLVIVDALVRLRSRFELRAFIPLTLALLVILGLRDYLFFVCLGFALLALAPLSHRRVVRYLAVMGAAALCLGGLAYALGFGFFGRDFVATGKYFDLDYINRMRVEMNTGRGKFAADPTSLQWGQGVGNDLLNVLKGVYYFFFSIDPTEVGRARQLSALPEMLLMLIGLPALLTGLVHTWRTHRHRALPVLVFAFGIMAMYSSATTNMGAMFRWRMQALPFFLIIMAYGLTVRGKGPLYRLMSRVGG